MALHIFLENAEYTPHSHLKLLSIVSYGLLSMESLIYEGIIKNVHLDHIIFRGLAFERIKPTKVEEKKEERIYVHFPNIYDIIDIDFNVGRTNEVISVIDELIKKHKIRFPFFSPPTVTITLFWTAEVLDELWSGTLKIRNTRAELAKKYGDVELELLSPLGGTNKKRNENTTISELFYEYMKNENGVTERNLANTFKKIIHPVRTKVVYHAYKKPVIACLSRSTNPLKRLDESYGFAMNDVRRLPRLVSYTLAEIKKSGDLSQIEASKYAEFRDMIDSLFSVFKTMNFKLVSARLSSAQMKNELIENSLSLGVSEVIPSSLIVVDKSTLYKFLLATITTYDKYLKDIYKYTKVLLEKFVVK